METTIIREMVQTGLVAIAEMYMLQDMQVELYKCRLIMAPTTSFVVVETDILKYTSLKVHSDY